MAVTDVKLDDKTELTLPANKADFIYILRKVAGGGFTLTDYKINVRNLKGDALTYSSDGDVDNPVGGTIYFNTTDDDLRWFDGIDWHSLLTTSESSTAFNANKKYRFWQGVGVTSENILTCSDRNESFGLNNSIQKYTHDGGFVSEVTSVYTETDPLGKFMSFGSTISDDGTYFVIPTYNHNATFPAPAILVSRIARFNKTTLAFVDEFDIGGDVAESATFHDGEWFVCYFDIMKIRKFNTSWVFQTEYNLSESMKPDGGYQSIFFIDDDCYLNWHGSNDFDGTYTPGIDKYSFDGNDFVFVENIDAPTYGSGQGVFNFDNKFYWVDRPKNSIIITNNLGDVIGQRKDDNFDRLTVDNLEATAIEFFMEDKYKVNVGGLDEYQITKLDGTATLAFRLNAKANGDTQIISNVGGVNKYLTGYDHLPIAGYRLYHYGFSKPVLFSPFANDKIGLNGITDPKSKLHVDGAVQVGDDTDTASVDKVGAIRYRTSGNNSFMDMVMQTGASTYAWVNIKTNNW